MSCKDRLPSEGAQRKKTEVGLTMPYEWQRTTVEEKYDVSGILEDGKQFGTRGAL